VTGEEFLESVWNLEEDIKLKEEELSKIQGDIIHLKAVDTSKDKVDGGQPMDLADKISKLMEVESNLNDQWDRLIENREQARKLINLVRTPHFRRVLIRRYVNHKKWWEIAQLMEKHTDYVKHSLVPAIAEFEQVVNKKYPGQFTFPEK